MPLAAYCYMRVVGRGSYGEVTLVKHRRDGKQYLHEKHILHRDLKTQNVFLTRTNIIKVGDLGIARVLENHGDMASTLIGTPYYMSPELFSNKPYNYKSDVWALGCCVYEMATLRHAFNAKDMNSLVYRIIEGKLPPMPRVYSPELAELIRTMLSRRPEERPSVRSILRQPYIKHQISLFLEATKAKTSKNNVKNGDSRAKPAPPVVCRKAESNEVLHPQPHSTEGFTTHVMGENKCLFQEKPVAICPLKLPANLKDHTGKPDVSSTTESLATISRVNIDILPAERRDSENEDLVQENQPRHMSASNKTDSQCNISHETEERLQDSTKSSAQPQNLLPRCCSDDRDGERNELMMPPNIDQKPEDQDEVTGECIIEKQDSIHPGLQPHSSTSEPSMSRQRRQKKREQSEQGGGKNQRSELFAFQESPPYSAVEKVDIISIQQNAENQRRPFTKSLSSSRSHEMSSLKDRPLSARERRRLKQSQEEMFPSGPSVERTPLSAAGAAKPPEECQPISARQFSSDCSITQEHHTLLKEKERKLIHCLSEEELSSSTSSTDKSDGDSREGKSHANEMSDLVQLMTQTLKLDSKESFEEVPNPISEFKLHRKYRDTLVLHGKVVEEAELQCKELSSVIIPGSEKIRRIVEVLRADVIQGLGVQLLEQVFELLEEEDELEREARLQKHMGEKYKAYSIKARQLKFFEENVNF
ncbi:serine/threonine-protein kinase Nek4 isoform X6 [Nannospalax galili]|uniref:serine/threonine-protein kinase Nek4 isoform X6 n=1 Tax=Nannospalax galili TaxID=1026970 RepID=UPI00111C5A2D|nr:serine/threonine-protein kinase Nek4 isoform X6 [Nannospalax galili]